MDGMLSALKGRRGGLLGEEAAEAQAAPQKQESAGLKGLVAALDEAQKAELLKILVKGQEAEGQAQEIGEGKAAGPGEKLELEEYVSEYEPEDAHESEEELMESMVSSADKSRAASDTKPRNLGERMRIGLANKLKDKKKG